MSQQKTEKTKALIEMSNKKKYIGYISSKKDEDIETLSKKEVKKLNFQANSEKEAIEFFKKKLKKNLSYHFRRLFNYTDFRDLSTYTEIKITKKEINVNI